MKLAFFSTKPYEKHFFEKINFAGNHQITFFDVGLTSDVISLIEGFKAVCIFVNDILDKLLITKLSENGVKFIVLRSASFNNIDIKNNIARTTLENITKFEQNQPINLVL